MKLGFPRALHYYDYYPFWAGFFQGLGIELVLSPPSNRAIMETGLKKAHTETCMPIKLLVGHIASLKDMDGVFLPRMVSVQEKTYLCPKMLGLPESVLSAVPEGMPVYSVTINQRLGAQKVYRALEGLAKELGKSRADVKKAYMTGQNWQKLFEEQRLAGKDFQAVIKALGQQSKGPEPVPVPGSGEPSAAGPSVVEQPVIKKDKPYIALLGHSYLVNEHFANHNLLKRLREKAYVRLIEEIGPEQAESQLSGLDKPLFWSHAQKIYGAGGVYADHPQVDGLIYLSCFGCGSDSMTQELVASRARVAHKPYMVLTIDEHTGEAGLITRIEAFLDMIERRISSESNLSAHG